MRLRVVRAVTTAFGIFTSHSLLYRTIAAQGAGKVVWPCSATQSYNSVIVAEVAAGVVAFSAAAFRMLSSLLGGQGIATALLVVQVIADVITKGNNLATCAEEAITGISSLAAAICLVPTKPRIKRVVAACKLRWVILLLVA